MKQILKGEAGSERAEGIQSSWGLWEVGMQKRCEIGRDGRNEEQWIEQNMIFKSSTLCPENPMH